MNSVFLAAAVVLSIQPIRIELKQKATSLVKQLGDGSFRKRESASKDLIVLGLNSREALEAGAKSSDPEIQQRCKLLRVEMEKMELNRRIRQFTTDPMVSLPGWKTFSEKFGSDALTRKVYGQMAEVGGERFVYYESEPEGAARFFISEYQRLSGELRNLDYDFKKLIDDRIILFSILFYILQLEKMEDQISRSDLSIVFSLDSMPITHLIQGEALKILLRDKPESPVFKKILLGWMGKITNDIAIQSLGYDFELCLILNSLRDNKLDEGTEIIKKLLKDPRFVKQKTQTKGYVLHAFANFAKKQDLKIFESFLNDDSRTTDHLLGNNGNPIQYQIQTRDIALAAVLHLNGEKIEDYGFDGWRFADQDGINNSIEVFSFITEENRKKPSRSGTI